MSDNNSKAPLDLTDLYGDQGKLIAPAVTAKPETPVDLSDLGGIRITHPIPTKAESPIDLSDIGGKLLGQHVEPEQPKNNTD